MAHKVLKTHELASEHRTPNPPNRLPALLAGVLALALLGGVLLVALRGGRDEAAEPVETVAEQAGDETNLPLTPPAQQTPQPGAPMDMGTVAPDPALAQNRTWEATINTSAGPITAELYGDLAPQAVASFVHLAQAGFFNATPCHRLTTAGIFVLQCGDPTGTGTGGPGYLFGPVENAPADNMYPAGTLAMARRGGDGASMGSQFFIVYADSMIPADNAGGYTVFGRITSGLDNVEAIAEVGVVGGAMDGRPAMEVNIEGVDVR